MCKQREMEQEIVCLSQWREKSEREGMLDEMIKQVVLYCMIVKHLSAGCMEQMSQGTGIWFVSTPLPPQNAVLPKVVSLAKGTWYIVQTLLSKVGSNEVGDNPALLVSWMPVVRHFMSHLNCSPPSIWTSQTSVGLPAWACAGTLTGA